MIYGIGDHGKRIMATPKGRAICPICRNDLIPKCGPKLARHWAHRHKTDCDRWSEETEWHIAWKSIVRESRCEIVTHRKGVVHRADILGNKNTIIELQHSPIPPVEVRDREKFYKKLIWVFDAAAFSGNIVFKPNQDYTTLEWYYPRASIAHAKKPVYFHLPCGNIFKLEYLNVKRNRKLADGWGRFIGWRPFFYLYLSSVVKPEYANGDEPEFIKDRQELDFERLRFHYNTRIYTHCVCDCMQDFPNCYIVKKRAQMSYIKSILK